MGQTEYRMTVHRGGKPVYNIRVGSSSEELAGEMERFDLAQRKLCIITDSTVAPLYLDEVGGSLRPLCHALIRVMIPAEEEYKNPDTVKSAYEALILKRLDRKDMLMTLGDNAVGDLCGFTVVTCLWGISFTQIPTMLLSQMDSSVGRKTGVGFNIYKNTIEASHIPSLVYTNMGTLRTLTKEQYSSGMGEIIKHGLIKDQIYYGRLAKRQQEILTLDMGVCQEMIERSDEIKHLVVEEDPMEQGERTLLNFGHTPGHVVEKSKNFTMLHGHCVELRCLSATYISARRGYISMEEVDTLKELMGAFDMSVSVSGLSADKVIKTTGNGKRMDGGVIEPILLESMDHAVIDRQVTADEMREGLPYIPR